MVDEFYSAIISQTHEMRERVVVEEYLKHSKMKRGWDRVFPYTDSHFYQEISWMLEQDGDAIIYRLGSDSPAMTKSN